MDKAVSMVVAIVMLGGVSGVASAQPGSTPVVPATPAPQTQAAEPPASQAPYSPPQPQPQPQPYLAPLPPPIVATPEPVDTSGQLPVVVTLAGVGLLASAAIIDAEMVGHMAEVTVRFTARISTSGTETAPTADVWTFSRHVGSHDPNWLLIATDDDQS